MRTELEKLQGGLLSVLIVLPVFKQLCLIVDVFKFYVVCTSISSLTGTNSAGEMTDSHISCYKRLVKVMAVMRNM